MSYKVRHSHKKGKEVREKREGKKKKRKESETEMGKGKAREGNWDTKGSRYKRSQIQIVRLSQENLL